MLHLRVVLAAALTCFAALPALPHSASAMDGYVPLWTTTGWEYQGDIGNADGDPQHELLFIATSDGRHGIFDALTGALEKEFPLYASPDAWATPLDVDGDGRVELLCSRFTGGPPLFDVYDWNGADYVSTMTHTDLVENFAPARFRSPSQLELLEISSTSVRVRDLTGALLFNAATDVPGWSGSHQGAFSADIDGDGAEEFILIESPSHIRVYKYYTAGPGPQIPLGSPDRFDPAPPPVVGFNLLWEKTGWIGGPTLLEGFANLEFQLFNLSDGRVALFDGLTGALDFDFTTDFGFGSQVQMLDLNGVVGAETVVLQRPAPSSLFRVLQWNGATYDTLFSHTEPFDSWSGGTFRGAGQFDFLETVTAGPKDVRIRDQNGNVLFQASSDLAGWNAADEPFAVPGDLDADGDPELLIMQSTTTRIVRYSGSYQEAWATPGWAYPGFVNGNPDADPAPEAMMSNTTDSHFALFDGATGTQEADFPDFELGSATWFAGDTDNDGRVELYLFRFFGAPSLLTAYDWDGVGYTQMFSHADSISSSGISVTRQAGASELIELGAAMPSDVTLRDALSGGVLFRASTGLAGWTGLSSTVTYPIAILDLDMDGVSELLMTDVSGKVFAVNYLPPAGVTTPGSLTRLSVLQNAPNPFTRSTMLRFSTPREADVSIRIVDAGGRLVRNLDRKLPAGAHQVQWDGRDEGGRLVPSGVFFYQIAADGVSDTRKLVRVK